VSPLESALREFCVGFVQVWPYCPVPCLVKWGLKEHCAMFVQVWCAVVSLGLQNGPSKGGTLYLRRPEELSVHLISSNHPSRAVRCACGPEALPYAWPPNRGLPRALSSVCVGSEVLLYHPSPSRTALHRSADGHVPAVQLLALRWWQPSPFP